VYAAQYLGRRDAGAFVTLTLVVLHGATGEMTCLCAGGEAPLVLRKGGAIRTVPVLGPALGLYPDSPTRLRRRDLSRGTPCCW
jgi:serine phosphatase RsbU (regulator of sigma subunit)